MAEVPDEEHVDSNLLDRFAQQPECVVRRTRRTVGAKVEVQRCPHRVGERLRPLFRTEGANERQRIVLLHVLQGTEHEGLANANVPDQRIDACLGCRVGPSQLPEVMRLR